MNDYPHMREHSEDNNELLTVEAFNTHPYYQMVLQLHRSRFSSNSEESDDIVSQCLSPESLKYPQNIEHLSAREVKQPQVEQMEVQVESEPSSSNSENSLYNRMERLTLQEKPDEIKILYHQAQLLYLTSKQIPIFPQSRKIMKTKKRNHYHQSYFGFADKKMSQKERGFAKRFDQTLQNQFEKLSPEEQIEKDQTYESIRCLKSCADARSKDILKAYKAKYVKNRKHVLFLNKFVKYA